MDIKVLTEYPATLLLGRKDPKLIAELNGHNIPILLDSGAHVSVVSRTVMDRICPKERQSDVQKAVRAFGGYPITLMGPVNVTVGVTLIHPVYSVAAEVPSILGYDFMTAAQLVLDTHHYVVWSRLANPALNHACQVVQSDASAPVPRPVQTSSTSLLTRKRHISDDGPQRLLSVHSSLNPLAVPFVPPSDLNFSSLVTCCRVATDLPPHLLRLYEDTVEHVTLSQDIDRQFRELLIAHTDTFATSSTDIGYCPLLEHDIDTGDALPIRQSPRRPPLSSGDAEATIIQEMLQAGVIQPSTSPWASPVCLVRKPDNSYRFCIDYRKVNVLSKKDAFPVPDIHDALDNLRGARWFATLDLLSGYWQLGLTDRARERSAFCTRQGLFEFVRMPFGLCGAPATFCRLMTIVLAGLLLIVCICYIDDIIIYARTQSELLERLNTVLVRLASHGFKIKPGKCVLFRQEIQFLGHIVNVQGIQPLPDKLAAICDWPVPSDVRDVRAFYGLASYYRRFVQGFASIAEPLTAMTRKGVRFLWTPEAHEAFCKLKQALMQAPILA